VDSKLKVSEKVSKRVYSTAHGAAAMMIVSKKTPLEHLKCPMMIAFAIFLTFFYAWPVFYFWIGQTLAVSQNNIARQSDTIL